MKDGIQVIRLRDDRYPRRLREIASPPRTLFVRGNAAALHGDFPVAVVGTRRMTAYGRTVTRRFVRTWALSGATVVSGLAYGIDAEAHEAAVAAGGTTVAVLASGVDDGCVSPKGNAGIARRILASGGAIVSEYPPGTPAAKQRFPERNRVVAGLSRATVVMEAPASSGALITAYLALGQDRDVFAVPGPVTSPSSDGANRLIAKGAVPLTAADDLLDHYGIAAAPPALSRGLDRCAAAVLRALIDGPSDADRIARVSGLSAGDVVATVVRLELDGLVAAKGGMIASEIDSATARRLLCTTLQQTT